MRSRALSMVVMMMCGCGGSTSTTLDGDGAPIDHDAPPGTSVYDARPAGGPDATPAPLPTASCAPAASGAHGDVPEPTSWRTFPSSDEGWLGAPAVADLDGDGTHEVIVARDNHLLAYRPDGRVKWDRAPSGARIWPAPVVANFRGDSKLEVVVAAGGSVYMYDAAGQAVSGFPATWRNELRTVAAGDLDADGALEIVAVTTSKLLANGTQDVIHAFHGDGTPVAGFPPNTTGTSGCDSTSCYVTGGFDQNLALGRIDGDDTVDIFAPHDNAYMSWHKGNGVAFDPASIFRNRRKVPGIRWFLDYAISKYGVSDNEDVDLQAHFTNSAPAIVDLDGDGENELVVLGSVQNASQSDREKGVVLFVLRSDGSRPPAWETPFHVPAYLAGLEDLGDNIVGATNEVAIGDLDAATPGLDMVFAGFDGKIHLVGTDRRERWSYSYTTSPTVLTSGVVLADLTKDGVPEVIFASYATATGQSSLFILDAAGNLKRKLALPGRGAMAVPTIADIDQNGTLEILVSLKDGDTRAYTVADSGGNCLLWPTGRGNLLRSGSVVRR